MSERIAADPSGCGLHPGWRGCRKYPHERPHCRHRARSDQLWRPRLLSLSQALVRPLDGLSQRYAGAGGRIAHTQSGFNNCHRHFPELLDAVKRGVLAAGALPIEFPTISLGEVFLSPTSMKFRNLMSIDTEEMIRAQPMDAVVLMGGCDKTVPAQLMGVLAPAGGHADRRADDDRRHRGQRLGACTDCRRFWGEFPRRQGRRRGNFLVVEGRPATTAGTPAGDGHGLDHGLHRRGAWNDPARHRRQPRRACGSAARLRRRPARWEAVKLIGSLCSRPTKSSTRNRSRTRCALACARRLDQCDHPSDRAIAGRAGVPVSLERLNVLATPRWCWSPCRSVTAVWKTSSPPAAWAHCCGN